VNDVKLKIRELTFEAAHYLPGHPKCGVIHGHTYLIRNLTIETTEFVDFNDVKAIVKNWDHMLIVPEDAIEFFVREVEPVLEKVNCRLKLRQVAGSPIVENIAKQLAKELLKWLPGVTSIRFELYEGSNQGTVYER